MDRFEGFPVDAKSYRMIPKQKEMDEVVHQIYQAMETEQHLLSALLVLCGDHGMNEAGNHGGSAESETSPALVFISPKLRNISEGRDCPTHVPEGTFQYYNSIQQSDIVPTLAALLGLPIPLNNLGVLIPQFLRFWSPRMSHKSCLQLLAAKQRLTLATRGQHFYYAAKRRTALHCYSS